MFFFVVQMVSTVDEFESLAAASRRRWRVFRPLLRRLRLRLKNSAWASSDPARGGRLEGEEQLGRSKAEQNNCYRFYLYSGKITLAAMYLRRVRVVGRCFAAALAHLSTVVTTPVPAAKTSA
jgi:hypothetical protein